MLYYKKSRFVESHSKPIALGAPAYDEGMALVAVDVNGELHLKPSAGTPAEVFYGVAIFDKAAPQVIPVVEQIIATGTTQTRVIAGLNIGSVRITANGAALNGATPEATIAGDTVTVPAGTAAGTVIEVTGLVAATAQNLWVFGGNYAGVPSALDGGADIGAMRSGAAFTSNFDTSAAWVVGITPRLGPNGTFTVGGSGALATGVVVSHIPSPEVPFLGLEVSV